MPSADSVEGRRETRLVAMTSSDYEGGPFVIAADTPEQAWDHGITEEEAEALRTGGAVPEGEATPFDAVFSAREKVKAIFKDTP